MAGNAGDTGIVYPARYMRTLHQQQTQNTRARVPFPIYARIARLGINIKISAFDYNPL